MSHRSSSVRNVLCALVAISCLGCDWSTPEAKKAKHLERAEAYDKKGQYHEAVLEYRNASRLDPGDSNVHYRLALAYLKLGGLPNLQGAFAELSRTVELNKENQDAQLKLGELYMLGNEPVKAREHADIVLVSAPQNTEGLILRGRSLLSEKRYQEGIAELKKAIDLDPKHMQTYIDLARAYYAMNDKAAAEDALNQGLEVDPRSLDILLALADFRDTTGKPEQAESIYRRVLELAPDNEAVYLKLAGHYQRFNKLSDAEATLQKLATNKPKAESAQIHLGDFYTLIGQPAKALTSYQHATEINPASTLARDKLIAHYLDTGKVTEAEAKVKEILDKNDKDLMGRFFKARVELAHQKPDEAISLLQGVLKDEPQFAAAHYALGLAFLQNRQPTQARASLTEAIKYNPGLGEARTALAQIYLAEGSAELAIEEAQAAVQINPRNIPAAMISGNAYLRKGDLAKSRQVFEAVAKALPNEALGPYHLGLVARAERNDPKALAYFEEALVRKPSAIEPIAQIAAVKTAQGKSQEARDRVMRQIEVAPQSPFLYDLLGQLWMNAKEHEKAETAFKKAIELDSSLLDAYMNLGRSYHQSGRTEDALREYETVLRKDSRIIHAHMLLGIIHETRKEYPKARERYEATLKLNPKFAPAANNLAWILVDQGGNLDVALGYAQTAREQKPDDPYIADTLGWIYYKKNAFMLAVGLLKEAAEKLPSQPVVQFHYGMAQHKNGDDVQAKKALQTALKLSQDFDGVEEARKTIEAL